jgi:hypothetical protein
MNVSSPYKYENGYIFLPVHPKLSDIDEMIELFNDILYVTSEFHISLLCVKDILSKFPNIKEKDIITFFNDFVSQTDLSLFSYTLEYRIASHPDGRRSLVQMVQVPFLKDFFTLLNSEFNISLDTQPTHITLYTKQKDKGIGINTQQQLSETWILKKK